MARCQLGIQLEDQEISKRAFLNIREEFHVEASSIENQSPKESVSIVPRTLK
jgi:hypothetical protein